MTTLKPTVRNLVQNLGIMFSNKNINYRLTLLSSVSEFFEHQEDRLKTAEKKIEELERRVYNVEVKDENCGCFCRKI